MKAGADGAVCVFDGIVRDNTRGRETLHLDYEAYEEMALKQMTELAAQATVQFGVREGWRWCTGWGAANGGGDERADRGGVGAPGGGVRCVPVADRYAEEDGADLEEGAVCGWRGVGGRRAVSGGDCGSEGVRLAGALVVGMMLLQQQAIPAKQQLPAPVERREPVETLHVQSRLVTIPLNVMDATGAPVGGLQKDDFAVSEAGRPQEIRIFEKESSTPLSIVLAIDTSESVYNGVKLEREAARHFVQTLLRPQDQIELTEFAYTVQEVVPFTNQAKRIDSGLGRLQPGTSTALYNAIYLSSQRLAQTPNDAAAAARCWC